MKQALNIRNVVVIARWWVQYRNYFPIFLYFGSYLTRIQVSEIMTKYEKWRKYLPMFHQATCDTTLLLNAWAQNCKYRAFLFVFLNIQQLHIFIFEYFVICSSLVLYSMVFCNHFFFLMFCIHPGVSFSQNSITFENMYLIICWFYYAHTFCVELRFCETFKVRNSITKILLKYCINLEQLNVDLPYIYTCMF